MFWRLGGSLLALLLLLGGMIAVTAVFIFLFMNMNIVSPRWTAVIVAGPIVACLSLYTVIVQSARKSRVRKLREDSRYKRAVKFLFSRDAHSQTPLGEEFQKAVQYLESKGIEKEEAKQNLRLLRKFHETGGVD